MYLSNVVWDELHIGGPFKGALS